MLGEAPYSIRSGDTVVEAGSLNELHRVIMNGARKGLDVQRYKGLGEMDAKELWETTMDPDNRQLLQISLDDMAAANSIFSTLMGSAVEARRNYIEQNAALVQNLDI